MITINTRFYKALFALSFVFFALFAMSGLSVQAQTQDPVVLTDDQDEYPLDLHIALLEDPAGQLTIEDVSSPEFNQRFTTNETADLNLGLVDTTYWVRFPVRNETEYANEWWLQIAAFELQDVSIYFPLPDGTPGYEMKQGGNAISVEDKDTNHYYPVFQISIPLEAEQMIYLRVESRRINLPLTLWSTTGFNHQTQKDFMILGIYWGILFIMTGYNFFLFLVLREKSYLYYVLFLANLLLVDILRKYLPQVWPYEIGIPPAIVTTAVTTLMVIFLLQFTATFLLTKDHTPRLHRFIGGLQIGLIITASLAMLWFAITIFVTIWLVFILLSIAAVFISGFVILGQGYRPARYFVLGLAMLLASIFLSILAVLGFVSTSYTQYIVNIGIVLMAFLMSLALADRINIIKQEQAKAQADVVQNQQAMLQLKDDFTVTLQQTNEELTRNIGKREKAEAETRQRNRELTLLNQVIAATIVSEEPETVLDIACRELVQAFRLTQAVAVLANEDISAVRVVADYHPAGLYPILGQTLVVEGNPLLEYLATHKEPLAVEDAQNDPLTSSIRTLLQMRNTASILMCPLIVDKEIVGGISLASEKPRQFAADELALILSVAEQVSGALARIRLAEERQQLEAQYYQVQKMEAVGRLAGGIAHDFNNLLVPIMGYVELAMIKLTPKHDIYANLEQVYKAAERAASLTQQILAFSRKQVLTIQPVNLNEIVTDFEKMLARLIGENIDLQISLASSLYQVKADRSQIEQILLNLVVNARDALHNEGKIIIETDNVFLDEKYSEVSSGPYVMLAVSDNGCGMDAETQRHIFEPFFTTKDISKGTGLGLSTVHGIVKQHGGHIWVYSEPEIGTAFKIYFPCEEEFGVQSKPQQVVADSLFGDETILLVEDDEQVRSLTRNVLQTYGYYVLEAHDGEAALALAATYSEPIHLLLTDVIMPGMNGKLLADKLTKIRPELKVLYMSGYAEEMIMHQNALEPGINLLQKPFNTKLLAQELRRVLSQ